MSRGVRAALCVFSSDSLMHAVCIARAGGYFNIELPTAGRVYRLIK